MRSGELRQEDSETMSFWLKFNDLRSFSRLREPEIQKIAKVILDFSSL